MRLHIGNCVVDVGEYVVSTKLPNGEVNGIPHDTQQYRAQARRLGYGDDIDRLNRTHEVMHTLLASWLGLPACPIFTRLADGIDQESEMTGYYEDAVMAIERLSNSLGIDLLEVAQAGQNTKTAA